MIFDQYTYFTAKLPELKEQFGIKAIYRCNGLINLNELLTKLSVTVFPCMVCEDSHPGTFMVHDNPKQKDAPTFYIIKNAKHLDDATRHEVYNTTFEIGQSILRCYATKSNEIPRISRDVRFFPVGPLPHDAFGYGFNYGLDWM